MIHSLGLWRLCRLGHPLPDANEPACGDLLGISGAVSVAIEGCAA